MIKMLIEKTKKGYPAFWEAGGSYTSTGKAVIVTDKDGQPKKAVYVRSRSDQYGEVSNAHHALIILEKGDHIINVSHHRRNFEIEILRVLDFEDKEGEVFAISAVEHVNYWGEWDKEPPIYLAAAVEAAKEKATCYHCRKPHFIE